MKNCCSEMRLKNTTVWLLILCAVALLSIHSAIICADKCLGANLDVTDKPTGEIQSSPTVINKS